MRTSEIRQRWLDYFAERGHTITPSASLVSPDPSILFTIAGMVPFIPYIVGTEPAPYPRAASVQKCIRTNDIDEVGVTTRHGTFFQMAGNFSFGDYFKEGAIRYAWDLLTGSVDDGKYGLDGDRLWMTIWEKDDVARHVWIDEIGVDPTHVQELPFEEISWSTGQPGPAGACSEIHYDRGPAYGPDGGPVVDVAGDRFVELWNLVFDEFTRGAGEGHDFELTGHLAQTAIDTGLGLERLAYVLQGKENMYEIDEVFPVIERVQELTGRTYGAGDHDADVKMRVVADHVRSALMLIGDGVRPSNEGRGYVLRRLIRRSVRSVRLLGYDQPVLPELLPVSQAQMKLSYPELETGFGRIQEIAYREEDAFRRTLTAGTAIFDSVAQDLTSRGEKLIPGADAFKLHDTYGFPIDLTLEMAREVGLSVDEKGFRAAMSEQRERARADAQAKKTGHADTALYKQLLDTRGGAVPFLGYTETSAPARVETILVDGRIVNALEAPATAEVVLDRTPFYAEMGGQLADQGRIALDNGAIFEVDDVQFPLKGLSVHRGRLVEGRLETGVSGIASIDTARRSAIARAHTATHMVHKALREELGETATQAGSENSPGRFRFDFRFGSQVPVSSLSQIEGRVNELLTEDLEVTDQQMPIDEARAQGAMALFGEKYGKIVRVVSIGGDWSKELCAGTHVPTTGYLGSINLLGESSIGSGVRRVDALVGLNSYEFQAREHALVSQLGEILKTSADDLPDRVRNLTQRLKDAEKQLASLRAAQLQAQAGALAETAGRVGPAVLLTHDAGEGVEAGDLRTLVTDLRARLGEAEPTVVAVAGSSNGKAALVVATNGAAREAGLKAGNLLRVGLQAMDGRGGGRPDLAQGGGGDPARTAEALTEVTSAIRSMS